MVTDIELLKNIYIRNFASFHDRGLYLNKERWPVILKLGEDWWDRHVKLVFTTGKMKLMFDMVDSIGNKFFHVVNKEPKITGKFEMRKLLAKFTTDVISSVAFGIDSNCKWLRTKSGLNNSRWKNM